VSGALRLFPAERVAEFYAQGWWSRDTWDSLLRGHVAAKPDAFALCDAPNRPSFASGLPRRLTWREVDAAVDRLAAALLAAGTRAGDVVGIQLPNVVELAVAYLAAARIGAIASPLPPAVPVPAPFRWRTWWGFCASGGSRRSSCRSGWCWSMSCRAIRPGRCSSGSCGRGSPRRSRLPLILIGRSFGHER
jgi:AMP-binding enzyme